MRKKSGKNLCRKSLAAVEPPVARNAEPAHIESLGVVIVVAFDAPCGAAVLTDRRLGYPPIPHSTLQSLPSPHSIWAVARNAILTIAFVGV